MRHEKTSKQKWVSILILLLLVALTAFVVAGCSGGGEEGKEGMETEKASSHEGEGGRTEQQKAQEQRVSDEKDAALLYTQNCGACHGHDGSGVVGPSIKGTSLSAEQIQKTIEDGGTEMPKFSGGELSKEQMKEIAIYVKDNLK